MPILTLVKSAAIATVKAITSKLMRLGRRLRAQWQASSGERLPNTDRIAPRCLTYSIAGRAKGGAMIIDTPIPYPEDHKDKIGNSFFNCPPVVRSDPPRFLVIRSFRRFL